MEWYYERGGDRLGPISTDEMRSLASAGRLSSETLVWNASFGGVWKRLADTELQDPTTAGPPPLPTTHVTEAYAWLLALVPAIGAIAEKVADDSGTQIPSSAMLTGYFAVNSALSLLDASSINKSGRNPKHISLGFWFWFIPAYLYKRSKTLDQNQRFLIVWIVTFIGALLWQSPDIIRGDVYLGVGIPACDARTSSNQIKKIFADIPLVKMRGLTAISVSNMQEVSEYNGVRSCTAKILASNGNSISTQYDISKQGNEFYYNLSLTN